jgi:hypothetical protein
MPRSPYRPHPIETSDVELPEELWPLAERLARNAHEVWARERLADGWTHGPARDDRLKQHPCLVPYDELPDSEKRYDRRTSLETLKAICALGFRIVPPRGSEGP